MIGAASTGRMRGRARERCAGGRPWTSADRIAFAVPDPEHRLAGVRLLPEVPRAHRDFDFDTGVWRLELPPPSAARMEYRVELQHPDGGIETTTDPGNPRSTPGAFGPKSVLELPGYAAPAWLNRVPPWPVSAELTVETAVGPVEVTVRSPAAPTRRRWSPTTGRTTTGTANSGRYTAAMIGAGRVPPYHLVLLPPGRALRVVLGQPGVRPRAGRRRPAEAAAEPRHRAAGDRRRRQPRRAGHAARPAPASGRVRRAVPAVGQLLPAAATTGRSPASGATCGSSGSPAGCCAAADAGRGAGRDDLRCGRGEPGEQPDMAAVLRRQGYPVAFARGAGRAQLDRVARRPRPASDRTAAAGVRAIWKGGAMADVEHTIGLLLGTEDDWPRAYEALLRRLGRGHRRRGPHAHLAACGSPSSRSTCATRRGTTWSSTGSPTGTTTRASGSRRSR